MTVYKRWELSDNVTVIIRFIFLNPILNIFGTYDGCLAKESIVPSTSTNLQIWIINIEDKDQYQFQTLVFQNCKLVFYVR